VRNGVEANKTAAQIRRELAGMGFTFPERTVARWAREAHAERFRVRASATLPGLVSQQSGWRVEELLDMIRGADLSNGWWARSAKSVRRLLEKYLVCPTSDARRALDAALLKHALQAAIAGHQAHQAAEEAPAETAQEHLLQ
jgi:hypothetical protein